MDPILPHPANLPYIYCCDQRIDYIPKNALFLFRPIDQLPDADKFKKKGNYLDAARCPRCSRFKLRRKDSRCYGFDVPEGLEFAAFPTED